MPVRFRTLGLVPAVLLVALASTPAGAGEPEARCRLQARTYNVADLIVPMPGSSDPNHTTEAELIHTITSTIAPTCWSEMGGMGSIDYYPLTMALVVNQTPDIQEQIADLLAALRRAQDREVAVEVRLIRVPRHAVKDMDFGFPIERTGCKQGVAFLNDKQVAHLMEAVQQDPHTNVMQAPKLTLFDGQTGTMRIDDGKATWNIGSDSTGGKEGVHSGVITAVKTGLRMLVRPVISGDRRSVHVKLSASLTESDPKPESGQITVPVTYIGAGGEVRQVAIKQDVVWPRFTTLALEKGLKVPDKTSVLLTGWVREGTTLAASAVTVPVLGDLPFLGRLFTNVGYSPISEEVWVLVTPRIIVQEEEESRPTGRQDCPTPARAKNACWATSPPKVLPAGAPGDVKKKVDRLMKQFCTLFKEGKYQEAEACAQRAHELDPDNGVAAAAITVARMTYIRYRLDGGGR